MFWLRSILLVSILSYLVTVHATSEQNQKISSESHLPSQVVEVSQPNNQEKVIPNSPEAKALLEQATQLDKQVVKLYQQGHYKKAIPLAKQVIELRKQILGENRPAYATSLNNLAALYDSIGDYTRAEPLYQQVLEITKKT
ncbi:MAG: tetratricopeptide repeat protein [Thioploca sp.]|nr:tetratricopeptide repeat protein [Thioploca sp.]